jgi:hypothetical protein
MVKKEWSVRHIEDEPQTEADWKDEMWADAVKAMPQTDCSWK